MTSCKDITALVSASLERRLSARERLQVRFHLLFCTGCTRFEQQLQFMRRAFKRRFGERD